MKKQKTDPILDVAKYNLDLSEQIMRNLTSNTPIDLDITETDNWDQLINQVNALGYYGTSVEDVLAYEEIAAADRQAAAVMERFQAVTKLDKKDIVFLVTAVALQCVRQYVFTQFTDLPERQTADEAGDVMNGKYGKDGKLAGKYYYATEKTIIGQKKVPFDAIAGSKKFGLGGDNTGFGKGHEHRYYTLGHDPILGYIFGTANILTNTMTTWNIKSYHIKYWPNAIGVSVPTIYSQAKTEKVFEYVFKRFYSSLKKGFKGALKGEDSVRIVAEAVIKEHLHLKSDNSTDGLPIPFLELVSPELVQKLAEYGIDAISVAQVGKQITKQVVGSMLINFIISVLHGMLYHLTEQPADMTLELYKAKTKEIILISNVMASASNCFIMVYVYIITGTG